MIVVLVLMKEQMVKQRTTICELLKEEKRFLLAVQFDTLPEWSRIRKSMMTSLN